MKARHLFHSLAIAFLFIGTHMQAQSAKKPKETIHEAAFFGYLNKIEQHIAYGSDLNQKDDYGSTPLNVAITFGRDDVALALIEAGADLTITAPDGSTPLHTSAFFGRVEVVEALIANGAALDTKNSYGSTALMTVQAPFDQLKPAYDEISRNLGPMGFKLDYKAVQANHKLIEKMLITAIDNQKR